MAIFYVQARGWAIIKAWAIIKINMVFEHIMENGAFALLEQMLHFPYFQKYLKLFLIFFSICCLKIENDVMI